MILTCPECATRYLIDPAQLSPGGRAVRCAKCGHTWRETPPADMPRQIEVEAPRLRPIPPGSNLPALANEVGPSRAWVGWLVFVLVLALIVGGGWFGRDKLVTVWPPAAKFYEALGVPLDTAARLGLSLKNLTSSATVEGGVTVLVVSGEIDNITGEARAVPKMRIALHNAKGLEIYHWFYTVEEKQIPAHGTLKFTSRLSGPPADANDLLITFVGDGEKPSS